MESITITDRSKMLVHGLVGVNVGWRHEKTGKTGISHFLEHAIFLGNDDHRFQDVETGKLGVNLNAMTFAETTLFFFTSTKKDFPKILNTLLSLIFHPDFNDDKLKREKEAKILTATFRESDYTPWEFALELSRNLLFNWDFRRALGTERDLKSLMRADLAAWHRKYYHTSNSFVMIHGDINEDDALTSINEAKIPLGKITPIPALIKWKQNEVLIKNETRNQEIVYGFRAPEYETGWEILSIILGNNWTSKMRQTNIDNCVFASNSKIEWTTTNGGFFMSFGASSREKVLRLDNNLWQTLRNLKISDEEFRVAKQIRLLEILKMKEEGESGLLSFVQPCQFGKYRSFRQMMEAVKKVEKSEVLDIANRLLTKENAVTVSVGSME